MKIAIMQPTYLSWIGYFALIDYVDKFILLDDVQFSYQSWQHRNKILTKSGALWLTVPCGKSNNKKLLNEEMRKEMGIKSREYCLSKYNVHDVNRVLLSEMGIA